VGREEEFKTTTIQLVKKPAIDQDLIHYLSLYSDITKSIGVILDPFVVLHHH
jgi:hypothetical protein